MTESSRSYFPRFETSWDSLKHACERIFCENKHVESTVKPILVGDIS